MIVTECIIILAPSEIRLPWSKIQEQRLVCLLRYMLLSKWPNCSLSAFTFKICYTTVCTVSYSSIQCWDITGKKSCAYYHAKRAIITVAALEIKREEVKANVFVLSHPRCVFGAFLRGSLSESSKNNCHHKKRQSSFSWKWTRRLFKDTLVNFASFPPSDLNDDPFFPENHSNAVSIAHTHTRRWIAKCPWRQWSRQ